MNRLVAYLSRDHAGKPYDPDDRGATADFDGDGRIDAFEREAFITARYLLEAEATLVVGGADVLPICDGRYSERHARVNRYASGFNGSQAYVAAHVNAGGGKYGAVFYDPRSARGSVLATHVAAALEGAYRATGIAAPQVKVIAADVARGWARPFETIKGVFDGRAVGICVEPCFIDTPEHRPLVIPGNGPKLIGNALAKGLLAWSETDTT